jgi:hypothetical protein
MDHWTFTAELWVNFPVDSSHPYFVLDHIAAFYAGGV